MCEKLGPHCIQQTLRVRRNMWPANEHSFQLVSSKSIKYSLAVYSCFCVYYFTAGLSRRHSSIQSEFGMWTPDGKQQVSLALASTPLYKQLYWAKARSISWNLPLARVRQEILEFEVSYYKLKRKTFAQDDATTATHWCTLQFSGYICLKISEWMRICQVLRTAYAVDQSCQINFCRGPH